MPRFGHSLRAQAKLVTSRFSSSFNVLHFLFTLVWTLERCRIRNVGGEVRIEKPEMNAMIGSKAPDLAVPEGSKFLPFPEFVVKSFFTDVH